MTPKVLLIVVAHPEHRRRFNLALERTPHHLVHALGVEDGFLRFVEVKPDLVLADAGPVLDGVAFVERLRALPGGDQVPMVGFSECKASAVFDAHLLDPFDREALLATLDALPLPDRVEPEAEASLTEAPIDDDRLGAPGVDLGTVVGFANPYLEPEAPSLPPRGAPDDGPAEAETALRVPVVVVDPSFGETDPPTPTERSTSEPELGTEVKANPSGELPAVSAPDRSTSEPELGTEVKANPSSELPAASAPDRPTSEPELGTEVKANPSGEILAVSALDPGEAVAPPVDAEARGLERSQLGLRLAQRVETLHEALDEADHYQLLGLDASADEARVHAAWFDLSIELHPDRFFLLQDAELKAMLYAIHRRVTEAHEVLGDPEKRAAYDRSRRSDRLRRASSSRFSAPTEPEVSAGPLRIETLDPTARIFAERAETAFARTDHQRARFHLHAVLAIEVDNWSAQRALAQVEARLGPTA